MNKIILGIIFLLITSCSSNFSADKLDPRKECKGDESNKTLSEMFCKEK